MPVLSSIKWINWKIQGKAGETWLDRVAYDTIGMAKAIYVVRDLVQEYMDEYLY